MAYVEATPRLRLWFQLLVKKGWSFPINIGMLSLKKCHTIFSSNNTSKSQYNRCNNKNEFMSFIMFCWILFKLDRIILLITDPPPYSFTTLSNNKKYKWHMTHVTHDTWHVTCDTWQGGGEPSIKTSALMVREWRCSEDISTRDHSVLSVLYFIDLN